MRRRKSSFLFFRPIGRFQTLRDKENGRSAGIARSAISQNKTQRSLRMRLRQSQQGHR